MDPSEFKLRKHIKIDQNFCRMGSRKGCISPDNSSSESYESVSTYSFEEEDMSCSTENAQPSSVKIAPEERSSH